jgi:hypothetical protein
MKWYWILLIALAAVAVGVLIAKMIKPKSSTSVSGNALGNSPAKPVVTVTNAPGVEVVKETNADGSSTLAVSRTV